jgi:hypothetical protein
MLFLQIQIIISQKEGVKRNAGEISNTKKIIDR